MPQGDWFILLIASAVFIVLGIAGIAWGMHEERRIFEALASKPDLREFSLSHIDSPQPGALKIGGWIALSLGIVILIVAMLRWQLGWPSFWD